MITKFSKCRLHSALDFGLNSRNWVQGNFEEKNAFGGAGKSRELNAFEAKNFIYHWPLSNYLHLMINVSLSSHQLHVPFCQCLFVYARFRSDWPVERVGKWRELDYTSPVYPSFACGAGNVLSADLVRWLALNADYLKPYQVHSHYRLN